jgi:hypothetical protein
VCADAPIANADAPLAANVAADEYYTFANKRGAIENAFGQNNE